MAGVFSAASSQGLRAESGVTSFPSNPVGLFVLGRPNNDTTFYSIISAVKRTANAERHELYIDGSTAGDPVGFAQASGGSYDVGLKGDYAANVWQMFAGSANGSGQNRLAYLDGVAGTANNTAINPSGANVDGLRVAHYKTTAEEYGYYDGKIAMAGWLKVQPTATQQTQLAQHRHPKRVFNVATEIYELLTFQAAGPWTGEVASIGFTSFNSPTWEANPVFLCTTSGIALTAVAAQSAYNLEGTGFNDAQGAGKVELCDNPTYASATIKTQQTINSWADGIINFTCVRGGLSTGTVYLFVTNNGGNVSPAGSVTLSGTDPSSGVAVLRRRQ